MKNTKFYIQGALLVVVIIFYFAHPSIARSFSPTGTIIFSMGNNKGQLTEIINEDVVLKTITSQPFITPTPKPYTFFTAELYDSNNNLLTTVLVDQRNIQGVPDDEENTPFDGISGIIVMAVPLDPSLAKIVFKNEKGVLAGQQTIDPSFFCNFNNVCESQLGENPDVCSADCQLSPTYIPVSVQPSPSVTPPPTRSAWKIILPLVIWFGLAIAVGVGWFIIRRRQSSIP